VQGHFRWPDGNLTREVSDPVNQTGPSRVIAQYSTFQSVASMRRKDGFVTAAFIVAGCWLIATPVSAEVVRASGSSFEVVNRVSVPVDAQFAWQALVDDIGQWWPADHTWWGDSKGLSIELRPGGCFCERHGEAFAEHMRIVFAVPRETLRMAGGLGPLQAMGYSGALDWRFSAEDGQRPTIELRYRASGPDDPQLAALVPVIDQVQAVQLGGLARYLESGSAARKR